MRFIEKLNYTELSAEAKIILSTKDYNESGRIKEILRIIYHDCCVYCQSSSESGSFGHIEHFYPKNPEKGFDGYRNVYENLHLSCQRCNTLKGENLPDGIYSPNLYLEKGVWVKSEPGKINREMVYYGHLLFNTSHPIGSTDRADNTIKLFDLNNRNNKMGRSSRRHLIEARLRVFCTVREILEAVYNLLSAYHPTIDKAVQSLLTLAIKFTEKSSPYSGMVLDNFGSDLLNLYETHLLAKSRYR